MKMRAFILILLLLGQPLGALAGALQASFDDASVQGHCETDSMNGQHALNHDVDNDQEQIDCGSSCDLCAVCAAVVTDIFAGDAGHTPSANSLFRTTILPSGIISLLLRPPILS